MASERRTLRQWTKLIERTVAPIVMIGPDRRLMFVNTAAEAWLGVSADDLLGKRCDYTSEADSAIARAAAALAPPPHLAEKLACDVTIALPAENAVVKRRSGRFTRLRQEGGSFAVDLLVMAQADLSPDLSGRDDLHVELAKLRAAWASHYRIEQLIGATVEMAKVRDQARAAAASSSARTVISGPPGTGREFVARAIHNARPGAGKVPLAPVYCKVLDVESLHELLRKFHRRFGLPTDEAAPTLMLLDIDQLLPAVQAELLGFVSQIGFDIPVIATSRWPLVALAQKGKFDRELAMRLEIVSIRLPSLRQRRDDIPLLVQSFVESHNALGGKQLAGVAPEALERLLACTFRGNVAQLRETIASACQKAQGSWIVVADLPEFCRQAAEALAHPRREPQAISLDEVMNDVEKELLTRTLSLARGNKSKAAELLQVTRPRLLRRLEQLGLIDKGSEPAVIFEEIAPEEDPPKKM